MNQKIKTRLGIFSMSGLLMSALAIAPSLANISAAFPQLSASMVQMLLSAPSLSSLIAALAVGRITLLIPKKTLAIIGIMLIIAGGITPFFFHANFYFLLGCATVLGFGNGTIMTITPSIISENFSGQERGAIFGQMTAFVSIGAVILTVSGGKLAEYGWQYNYLAYLIALPLLFIVCLCLPQDGIASNEHPVIQDGGPLRPGIPPRVIIIGLCAFIFLLAYNAFPNNIALYLATEKIGDVTTASHASALLLISGLISGLLFGHISKITASATLIVAFLVLGFGMALTTFITSPQVALTGSFITGFSLSMFMARAPFLISTLVSVKSMPMSIAVFSIFTSIAGFTSPLIINNLAALTGEGSPRLALIVSSLLALCAAVILLLTRFEKICLKNKVVHENNAEGDQYNITG
ncbi:MFS transporter [Brenneria tiliae]|uniref:MFS transporter n=1 Tax=Brenneria tiliae TaxID=2914984 RepID=A0ABT0MWP9_9GAMM|nr:MFS transporter [Brenneria tiliae]MCL2894269.1 MFS transporter [Brenneria tiliae]